MQHQTAKIRKNRYHQSTGNFIKKQQQKMLMPVNWQEPNRIQRHFGELKDPKILCKANEAPKYFF